MAPADCRELGKAFPRNVGPMFPDRTVPSPISRNDPSGSVTHFVDQSVSKSVSRVQDLKKEKQIGTDKKKQEGGMKLFPSLYLFTELYPAFPVREHLGLGVVFSGLSTRSRSLG